MQTEQQPAEPEPEEEQLADPEEPDDGVPRVLVTGASGFVATHLIKLLLEQGRFHVRGTVRSLKREEKVKPLRELFSGATYPLRLIEADLTKPKTWNKAVEGCMYVFHVASPFPDPAKTPKDENELIKPAVEGTKSVLQACVDAGTVKRVVLTSSVAAVSCGMNGIPGKPADYVYSETDWSEEEACPPYEKSKLRAEKSAWEFVKELEEEKQFELVVLNPGYIQGPLLSRASGEGTALMCSQVLNNKMLPNISFGVIDVRDVAAAHIAAMEKPEAAGNRYILVSEIAAAKDFVQVISQEFTPQGYKISTKQLPKVVVWASKLFNPMARAAYPNLGKVLHWSSERMKGELGIQPRPMKEAVIDLCYSLIDLGIVKKARGYLGHPSTRPEPEPKPEPKPEEETATEGEKKEDAPAEQDKPQKEDAPAEQDKPQKEDVPAEQDKPQKEDAPAEQDKPQKEDVPAEQDKPQKEDAPAETPVPSKEPDAPAEEKEEPKAQETTQEEGKPEAQPVEEGQ